MQNGPALATERVVIHKMTMAVSPKIENIIMTIAHRDIHNHSGDSVTLCELNFESKVS